MTSKNKFYIALLGTFLSGIVVQAEVLNRDEALAQSKVFNEQSIIDRSLYITPPPKGFKPAGKGVILKLKLTLEKTKIRRGTPIRYRFEIINVGSEPFLFGEFTQSFFKTGRLPSDAITMSVKNPDGRMGEARSAFVKTSDTVRDEINFPPGLTDAERAARLMAVKRKRKSEVTLLQRLAPGEKVHTLGDASGDGFRTLNIDSRFSRDGIYELALVYDAYTKNEKTSNPVFLEVVP